MSNLQIPLAASDNPYGLTSLATAYAVISGLAFDFTSGQATVTVHIYPDSASFAAHKAPLVSLHVRFGETLVPANIATNTPAVVFPTLSQLIADSTAGPALSALHNALTTYLKLHPKLAGAVDVP